MTTATDTSLLDNLTNARTYLANLRNAIAEASARADETEKARIGAEKAYVDKVADAMITGKATPAKGADLTKLQNDDDIADAALDSLKQRISQADGEVRNAAWALLQHEAQALANQRAEQVQQAFDKIIPAFNVLVRAIGRNESRAVVEQMAANGAWSQTDAEHHRDALKIAQLVPEIGSIDSVLRDFEAPTVRPRQGNIGEYVTAFLTV